MYKPNYPKTVGEVLDSGMVFKGRTLRAVRAFAESNPWQGDQWERRSKFLVLHNTLCRIYKRYVDLVFRNGKGGSGSSCYIPRKQRIVLRGRLSVVTYLHEFGHALGKDERDACRWSINLFARCFPEQFAQARFEGHMIVG